MTDRNRWIALVVLCTGMLMIVLDMTIVNVALPSIQADLGFSQAGLAWVVNAYLIAFAGLLLLAGRLGDLAGRRNVFLAGLAVFTVASLLCGLAANQEMLVAARFLQGMGGALTSAVILGMIVTMFPEPREQAKAIGVFAFVASAGAAVGLLAGGILTQVLNWHWIFIVNLPVGAATAIAALRVLERDRGAAGLAGSQDARPGSRLAGAPRSLHRPAEDGAAPADAAADLRLARGDRREPSPGARDRGHVRDVLPRLAVPAPDPRLRPAADRPGLPASRRRDGGAVGPLHRPAGDALRPPQADVPWSRADRRRAGPVRRDPGRGDVPEPHLPGHAADRCRRRPVLPRADDTGHVQRHAAGCRPGLGPGEHHGPGRRCAGARRAGDGVRVPDQRADRTGPPGRGGPDRRLSPGLLDRLRPGGRGHRGRRHHPAPGPGPGRGHRAAHARTGRSHLRRLTSASRRRTAPDDTEASGLRSEER